MESMHLYKRGGVWWVRFRDHKRVERRMRCTTDRRTSENFSRQVAELISIVSTGQHIPDTTAHWLMHQLDASRRKLLSKWGLADPRRLAAGDPLDKQLGRWRDGLKNRGRPEKYFDLRYTRAHELLVKACGFGLFRDIDAERTQAMVGNWKREGKKSDYTIAHYVSAAKGFTRWMYLSRLASFDPLAILSVSRGKARKIRRALDDDEQATLITGTLTLPTLWGITGEDRSILYRVALGTGLRAGALQRLDVRDVDLKRAIIRAEGSGADNKRSSPKPIPSHLVEALRLHLAKCMEVGPLFVLPPIAHLAEMLRADCKALGIDTRGVDFHSLRHTYGTTMARRGVHPKTLMALMDHGTIQMTMKLYVHSFPQDEAAAVELMPDPAKATQRKATA